MLCTSELALKENICFLINHSNLDEYLSAARDYEREILLDIGDLCHKAFELQDRESKEQVHYVLSCLYELNFISSGNPAARNQYNLFLLRIKSDIEQAWERSMLPTLRKLVEELQTRNNSESFCTAFTAQVAAHVAANHRLFDFLANEANRDQIQSLFHHDASLNMRFFDVIALAAVGSNSQIRSEIAKNLWDEAGNGNQVNAHTTRFGNLLHSMKNSFDKHSALNSLSWEGLAGYNLFSYLAINRKNYAALIGCLAATELLDPSNYKKLLRGCARTGLTEELDLSYYREHIQIDVDHADGWLNNVIDPLIANDPVLSSDILFGAFFRLETCAAYYDWLFEKLREPQGA